MITYSPQQYFTAVFLLSWIPLIYAVYVSRIGAIGSIGLLCGLFALTSPLIVSLVKMYKTPLMRSFANRLNFYTIDPFLALAFFFLISAAFLLAVGVSILFGESYTQLIPAEEYNVIKGRGILSLLILALAPILEELGWRGYGVDSLRACSPNLFIATLVFALLWSLWHLPLFFVKGYYQNQLWNMGWVYVANFFISIIPAAFLLNWVYYRNDRNIVIVIVCHFILNFFAIVFPLEQITKCIMTVFLSVFSVMVVLKDMIFFFN